MYDCISCPFFIIYTYIVGILTAVACMVVRQSDPVITVGWCDLCVAKRLKED